MQIKLFTSSILDMDELMKDVNKFLASHRILDVQKSSICSEGIAYWTFCISYLPANPAQDISLPENRKEKIDYKNLLSEEAFARFCEYRKLRKQIAESDVIPPFAIFTDAELAKIAEIEKPAMSDLKKIPGIGQKKLEKYGIHFCYKPQETNNDNETNREFDGENS